MEKLKVSNFILLHGILLMYSLCGIFSKLASSVEFLSLQFIFYYTMVLLILFVYAIFWQQILKKVPLTTAFANKAVTVIWGMVWGTFIFKEKIQFTMIIGAILIFIGIYLVVSDNGR